MNHVNPGIFLSVLFYRNVSNKLSISNIIIEVSHIKSSKYNTEGAGGNMFKYKEVSRSLISPVFSGLQRDMLNLQRNSSVFLGFECPYHIIC